MAEGSFNTDFGREEQQEVRDENDDLELDDEFEQNLAERLWALIVGMGVLLFAYVQKM